MSPKPIKKRRKTVRIQEYFQWVFPLVVSVILALLLTQIFGNAMIVKGDSMSPTYKQGDIVFVDKISYRFKNPKRNDVVVFNVNTLTDDLNAQPHYTISRIVGMPGENVQIIDGALYINEEKVESPYMDEDILQPGVEMETVTLGNNEYFVLGDNCNFSQDSRYANVGNIKKDAMIGKILKK